MSAAQQSFYFLAVALAIGLLIGVERGWRGRDAQEGGRVAGLRTYGLVGLLGGACALLGERLGAWFIGLVAIGLAVLLATAYMRRRGHDDDIGITSLVAALVTFMLGVLAGFGDVAIAAAAAVVATMLLNYKPQLHSWIGALEGHELRAGLQLALISVVLLPLLPDRGYGPWNALNPYAIWWMVVLIAAISFVGYFAVRIAGARRGIAFTGLFGGLASSTGVTLHFSRAARAQPALVPLLAGAVLLACGTMFPRMVLVATLLNPALFAPLAVPAAVMALLVYLPGLWYFRTHRAEHEDTSSPIRNPLELKTALSFGMLLAVVLLLGKALQSRFGDAGVLALAAASGISDVDAITLSLARMVEDDLALGTAALGIVIAATVNSLTKSALAIVIGGPAMGLRVGLPLGAGAGAGLLTAWWWLP